MSKSCYTCLYRATHEKCDDCLTPPGWKGEPHEVGVWNKGNGETEPIIQDTYAYANWAEGTLGESLERLHALEVSGARNIVIGGSGEAEVNSKWTVKEAHHRLCRVSKDCGYMTSSPRFDGERACIRIQGSWNGPRFLFWVSGVFDHIEK